MKKTTLKALLLVCTGMLSITVTAQNLPQEVKEFGKKIKDNQTQYCGSTEYEELLKKKYPNRQSSQSFEQWIAPKVAEAKAKSIQKSGNVVVTLPVVVHVVHNGDAEGFNENICEAQILSQI